MSNHSIRKGGRPLPGIHRAEIMWITKITTVPSLGETPQSGWACERKPSENLHTLVEVHDERYQSLVVQFTHVP